MVNTISRSTVLNIVSKLSVSSLAFGLILLVVGGVRTFFFRSSPVTNVLIMLGLVISVIGIGCAVVIIVMLRTTPSDNQVVERSSTIAELVERTFVSNGFTYGQEDLHKWEAPPTYAEATSTNVA